MNDEKYLMFMGEMDIELAHALQRMRDALIDYVFRKEDNETIRHAAINITSLHIKAKKAKVPSKYKGAHSTFIEATTVLNDAVSETIKKIENKVEFEELFYFQIKKYDNFKKQALEEIMRIMDE